MKTSDYMDMLNTIFRLMIYGITNERLRQIRELEKDENFNKMTFFMQLKELIYDEKEQRLALWLPLN